MKAPFGIALSLAAAACVPPPPSAGAPADAGPPADTGTSDAGGPAGSYAIVVLPDTQYYASSWPEIFDAQTQWIAENREALRIAFVLHTGDIVDADVPEQWEAARRSLSTLEGRVPFALAAGNHDYANIADRMGMINAFFPPSRFAAHPWFGGTFEPEHVENSYYRFDAGAGQWLVLALEFGPRDEVLAWADGVLKAFSDTPAIVITHAYLTHDGTRYDRNASPHQAYNPHDYVMMGQPRTTINDGEEMWRKLILPNGNVRLVFSGHDVSGDGLPPGTAAHLTSTRTDGSVVHEVLANYQTCVAPPCETFDGNTVRGGSGYLRILRVSPADRTVSISTYSPYLHRYLEDPSNAFTLPMN
ncbi:MAG TPA: metallophosphoesterase [Polyangia bacterium]